MNKDQIAETFENLLEHLEVEIKKLSEEVKKASESQDYQHVQQTARKAEQITVLRDKVRSLYRSWATIKVGRQVNLNRTFRSETQGNRKMRIENKEIPFTHAYDILLNAAEWLIQKGKLNKNDCPVQFRGKRYLIHTIPEHLHRKFMAPKKLSNGLYIETHYGEGPLIQNARNLLRKYGYGEDVLKIL